MRSSIACLRCRKSKIKCDNNGGTGPCETCIKVGHLCQYPEAATYVLKRSEPGKNVDRDSPHERKRIRKIDETSDNHRAATYSSEVLSYPFLTSEIWDQLFDIYKLHFASELPFLHLPTLKERMRHGTGAHATSPGLNFVLLGVLTLTARFHIDLVKYVAHLRQRSAQTKPDPFATSEFFANALTEALGPMRTTIVAPTVERAQAYLMLGLHEWRQSRSNNGIGAWMYAGIAVRLALSLRLNLGDTRFAGSEHAGDKGPGAAVDVGIAREIKRRTMFSCLVMDRMLACGSERPAMIRTEDIEIQLPCTEMAFDLALDVQTGYLRSSLDGRSNPVAEDNVLARFVQLTNIWRGITRYSIEGGRLSEQLALWDQNSRLMQLQRELDAFNDSLPSTFTLSRQNYYRHDNHQAHSIYVSLHMLSSLCQVMLHRETLPLLPLRCRQPEGPLDQSISSTSYAPSGFWNASADKVFGASRDIVDLVDLCRDKLPMSPLTFFAAWSAGMIAIYAHHFPAMDVGSRLRGYGGLENDGAPEEGARFVGVLGQAMMKMSACLNRVEAHMKCARAMDMLCLKTRSGFQDHAGLVQAGSRNDVGEIATSRLGGDIEKEGTSLVEKLPRWNQPMEDRLPPLRHFGRPPAAVEGLPSLLLEPGRGAPETKTHAERIPTPRPTLTPTLNFRAINNQPQIQPEPGAVPSLRDRDWWPRGGSHLAERSEKPIDAGSLLVSVLTSQVALRSEDVKVLECQRIGVILNDIREFSGAGTLGGDWWESWERK